MSFLEYKSVPLKSSLSSMMFSPWTYAYPRKRVILLCKSDLHKRIHVFTKFLWSSRFLKNLLVSLMLNAQTPYRTNLQRLRPYFIQMFYEDR